MMNPGDRKLRLRKTTLRNLDMESASNIRGGVDPTIYVCPPHSHNFICPKPVPLTDATCSCELTCQ